MKKRIFYLLLALALVIGLLPVTAQAGQLDNGLEYEVYEDHVEITGYTGEATEIVIPAEIEDLPVTSIGEYAFSHCSSLISIDLPDSLTNIDDRAFWWCTSLACIDLPDSITSIGKYTFYCCKSLTSITMPDSITSIGECAFSSCESLTSIDLPDNLTSIGMEAFQSCTSLTSIDLPDSLTSIGHRAFSKCSSLAIIDLPGNVTSIGGYVFKGCTSLIGIHVDENNLYYSSDSWGVLFDKEKTELIQAPGAIAGSYTIPDGVTNIDDYAFYGCSSLTSIDLPDSLTSIGEYAFYGCSSLASIDLPDSFTCIGKKAFYNCTGLTNIDLPDSLTSIGEEAFEDCTSLTSIDFPDSLTSIGKWAFYGCSNLVSINLPDSLTYIGARAFAGCTSLTNTSIPEGVTNIGDYAFEHCTSLSGIHVDENNLYYSSDDRGVLFNKEKTELLQAPGAIEGSYAIPDGVTDIYSFAFQECSSLTAIEIPDGITKIRLCTFYDCTSLATIELPDSLTYIDDGAFGYCTSLTSISIPASVTYISDGYGMYDESAFAYCTSLTGFHVDGKNLYYSSDDQGVLFDKEKTELLQAPGAITGSYVVPDSVTSIGDRAFYDCTGLTSINLPDSLTSIGYQAFIGCASLTGIHVDDNNLYYSSDDRGVLFNKEKTKLIQAPGAIAGSYAISDGVTYIGDWAFCDCESLTNISIADSVTSIGYGAFVLCKNLTNISIPSSVTAIDDFAFDGCENLTTIIFKGDAPEFGDGIFSDVTATAYYPAGNDTWTEDVMPYYGSTITWVPYTPTPFADIPIGSFYADPVAWALENNITTGATADTFNPNGQCLRAQVVTFLHRAAGNPEPTADSNPFTDVKTSDFFYKPVLWAVEKGITNGVSATEFGSYAVCNRAAVVTFLWRAAGSPEPASNDNPFTDVKDTDFFYKPVLWAIENGITNGISATEFGPTADCNRAQVVTFLYRAYN